MVQVDHEVIIIGGGPSGSAAAIHLSGSGFDVCLIEKKAFPRETLCGEFLSGEVFKNLQALGIEKQFLSLKPNKIKSFKVYFENGRTFSGEFDFNAYGIKRSVFDAFLLETAKSRGVKIIQPAEVTEIHKRKGKFILTIKGPGAGTLISSRMLIAAYGKQNSLDLKLKRNFSRYRSEFIGVKLHVNKKYFASIKKEEIGIYTGKNIYCGVNSVDDDTLTLCFLQKRPNTRNSVKEILQDLSKTNKDFNKIINEDFFGAVNEHKVYGTGNIYFGRRTKVENGIITTGDAAGVISPFSGDGIGMALDSAKLASQTLVSQKGKMDYSLNALMDYEKKWDRLFGSRIQFSKILQNFLLKSSFKKIANPALIILKFYPDLSSLIIRKTRS